MRFLRKVCIDYAQGYRFFLKIICQICAGIFEEKEIRKKTCSDGIRQDGKYILWVKWRSQDVYLSLAFYELDDPD